VWQVGFAQVWREAFLWGIAGGARIWHKFKHHGVRVMNHLPQLQSVSHLPKSLSRTARARLNRRRSRARARVRGTRGTLDERRAADPYRIAPHSKAKRSLAWAGFARSRSC